MTAHKEWHASQHLAFYYNV